MAATRKKSRSAKPSRTARKKATTIIEVPGEVEVSPARVRELMDLLELPKGTTVNVSVRFSSAIVR